jgi:adenylylsulfate kinase
VKSIRGVWFFGVSGAGKTFASRYLKNLIKKSCIIIDGDDVRKYVSFDLGYSLKDREIQIRRVFGITKILVNSKIFPIISTVYMNSLICNKLRKEKILLLKIERNHNFIRDKKKIYKLNKNIVGRQIKYPNFKYVNILNNNSLKDFKKNIYKRFLNG